MGSQCSVSILAKARFDIAVLRDEVNNVYEFAEGTLHELHFHFPTPSTITFYPDAEYKTPLPQFAHFTITCVADFLWFILMLNSEFSEVLQVAKSRPDPIKMVLSVIESW